MAQNQSNKTIFDYLNYRIFTKDCLAERKGKSVELAKFMRASPSLVSSVLKGTRDFTTEQSVALGEFLKLSDLEVEYLLVLVEISRAATTRNKTFLERRIKKLRQDAWREAVMGADTRTLTVDEKYVFYSDWTYSAIRMLTTISKFRSAEAIARHLGLPLVNVKVVLEFLVKIGFCEKDGDTYFSTSTSPDIKRTDPVTKKHLQNCRQVAAAHLHKTATLSEEELIFSAIASYSKENALRLKDEIYESIKRVMVDSKKDKAEVVYYFNLDFFPL